MTLTAALIAGGAYGEAAAGGLTVDDIAKLRRVTDARLSPSGELVAYVLEVPRKPYIDDDGPAWRELHVAGPAGRSRPFVTGEISVSEVAWTPDGSAISFLAQRDGDEHKCLYVIAVDGGEARRLLCHVQDIEEYSWSPDGAQVAYLAEAEPDEQQKKLEEKGFTAQVYEEDWRPVRVWVAQIDAESPEGKPLEMPGSASELHWSPRGDRLVVALAPTSLIDDDYMRRQIHVVDAVTGEIVTRIENPGKLGQVAWSPDGSHLAVISAEDLHDPAEGRLMVVSADSGELKDLLPGFLGHVQELAWRDQNTVLYVAHQGTVSTFGSVALDGTQRRIFGGGEAVLESLSLSANSEHAAFVASSASQPAEVFVADLSGAAPVRWTENNSWLSEVRLASQESITYKARDGLELEGILVHALDETPGQRYPLVMIVHGGPEGHLTNGWVTSYSRPGQTLAARGFAVFYPNYRGGTGRGVEFSKLSQSDYGGKEFDDLVDAVDHLVEIGLVDREKVGITGGSYGGFASAWAATKLTEHFAASVMFVGISDHISKAGTTDIPQEMFLVHSRRWPWQHWDWFRERSPLYYVEQARTPILILHGTQDPRVHPSQSLELHRYLKLVGKTPVRLVLYPGEKHGNRRAAARLDYSMRLLRWMEHYLMGPGGEPPPYRLEHDPERLGSGDDS